MALSTRARGGAQAGAPSGAITFRLTKDGDRHKRLESIEGISPGRLADLLARDLDSLTSEEVNIIGHIRWFAREIQAGRPSRQG
jgi:hypothetical protein